MSDKVLCLHPKEMTPARMRELEAQGLLLRLAPHKHDLPAQPGETLGGNVYEPKEGYGPHKLISVTVNRVTFAGFGTHPDYEEFWLIGDPCCKPLYLVIARCARDVLESKIKQNALREEDFVVLRVKYNDPEVSFFVMPPEIPHGEAILEGAGEPPTFYVTESRDLPLDVMDFGGWELRVVDTAVE